MNDTLRFDRMFDMLMDEIERFSCSLCGKIADDGKDWDKNGGLCDVCSMEQEIEDDLRDKYEQG